MNSPSVSRIHYEFTIFHANPLWMHNEFIIYFANSLWIHYLFYDITMIWPSVSRIHYLFANYDDFVYYAKSLWTHFLFRVMSNDRFFVTEIHYGFTVFSNDEIVRQPLRPFYDLIVPKIILNFNCRRNSESKHMYL